MAGVCHKVMLRRDSKPGIASLREIGVFVFAKGTFVGRSLSLLRLLKVHQGKDILMHCKVYGNFLEGRRGLDQLTGPAG